MGGRQLIKRGFDQMLFGSEGHILRGESRALIESNNAKDCLVIWGSLTGSTRCPSWGSKEELRRS